jgi:spermidine/putrescine transport system permease protein
VLRGYSTIIYLFLYAPIALIVLFSFNSGNNASDFQHFALTWYGKAANNTFVIEALENSLIVAGTSAALATIMGTMAALALQQVRGPLRLAFDGLTYISIMVSGIVIGIATLIALVNTFALLNGFLASLWRAPAMRRSSPWAMARSSPPTRSSPWRWSSSSCAPASPAWTAA